jgi:hypothetical protein
LGNGPVGPATAKAANSKIIKMLNSFLIAYSPNFVLV